MPKVNFYLQTPNEAESYIRLQFNYPAGRLVYYLGEQRIKTAWWNAGAQRVRKSVSLGAEINSGLDRLEALTLEIFRRYRNDGRPLPLDLFRLELDKAFKGKVAESKPMLSLFDFWALLIAERSSSPNYKRNTWRAYQTALLRVKEFAASARRRVDFDTVDLDFHAAFVAWMGKKAYSPNFTHKVVAVLKVVMGEAMDRGMHTNVLFKSRKFTVKTFEPEHVYLNEAELQSLAALTLSDRLGRVRDLFLIGCYTGLRFSDYSKLRMENLSVFDGVAMLNVRARKTDRASAIPIYAPAQTILDKHQGVPPAGPSNQKMNTYLKELCRLAGIVEPVRVVSVKGGERVEVVSEKCELVTTHTARRSYASNEYLRCVREGRSIRPLMDILGMTKEQTLLRYVKVSREQTAAIHARQRGA